jgi:casein kinase 1
MEKTTLAELCEGIPKEFQIYLEYCRKLKYEDTPDYGFLKRLFK